jgi:hypothetical protein
MLSVLTAIAFYNDPAVLWAPLVAEALVFVSYRGAVVGAVTQGVLQQSRLRPAPLRPTRRPHDKLPDSIEDEQPLAPGISEFMADGGPSKTTGQ